MSSYNHSVLRKIAVVGTVASSAIVSEARAQEAVPETEASKIVRLISRTLDVNTQMRLTALRDLESAWHANGASAEVQAVQQSIRDELAVQDLIKILQGPDVEAAMQASTELAAKWLDHDRYAIRLEVSKALDTFISLHNVDDPRWQQSNRDLEAFRGMLSSMQPVSSIKEWTVEPQMQALHVILEEQIVGLNSDKFSKRSEHAQRILAVLTAIREVANPLPPEIQNWLNVHLMSNKSLSLEQTRVLELLLEQAQKSVFLKSTLPPMRANAWEFLLTMQSNWGVQFELTKEQQQQFCTVVIESNTGTNDFTNILQQICLRTNTYPASGNSPRHIRLVSQNDVPKSLVVFNTALGVLTPKDPQNEANTMQLFTDPQYSFVQIDTAEVSNSDSKALLITLNPANEACWNYEHSGGENPCRKQRATIRNSKNSFSPNDSIVVHAWVASMPYFKRVSLEEVASINDGPHNITMEVRERDNGTFETCVFMGVYDQQIPWPNTPHSSDKITYAAADASNIILRKNGEPIIATRTQPTINFRTVRFTLVSDEKPDEADVHTFRSLNKQRVTFLSNGEPELRQTLNQFIPMHGE